jgi:ribosome-associated translation inhibitor RaiA
MVKGMDLDKIEEAMKKMVGSLDKATRMEAVLEDQEEFRIILSKGTHSDRATLSKELLEGFLEGGKGGHEVKKAIGKVISKLNLMSQKRR